MPKTNKTSNINYRLLSTEDSAELRETNLEAFSDYFVPLQMSVEIFENHIAQNAIDLNLSVGAFAESKMVGFTLNGFGLWNEKKTAYDAGTGVIPDYRRKGIGKKMFDFLFPTLHKIGIEQMLLEVIKQNEKAIGLYEKLGFEKTRNLLFFEQGKSLNLKRNDEIEIREIEKTDWDLLKTFWDGNTSWQFSSESIDRVIFPKLILGAFLKKEIVGYGVVYPNVGTIAQLAVARKQRRRAIASTLLLAMREKTEKDKKLRFGNVDESLKSIISFAENLHFKQTTTQFEMIKTL